MSNPTSIQDLERRYAALKSERSSWLNEYLDVSTFILPYNNRYFVTDRNKGWDRSSQIYDNTPTMALYTLAAGLMSGVTSPTRPWFALTTTDRDLRECKPVKEWLAKVTEAIEDVFAGSNVYNALHEQYIELAGFGTSCSLMCDDPNTVMHLHNFTAGEYSIGTDWQGNVTTMYRLFEKPVAAVVNYFGYENCSKRTQGLYDVKQLDQWVSIGHAIEPRTDRDTRKKDNTNMAFKSCYWEFGQGSKAMLSESGYKSFPCLTPRWSVIGQDVYGRSPAMVALGDSKGLQSLEFKFHKGIDYQIDPPLQIPTSLKNQEEQFQPGGQSYYDAMSPGAGVRTAFEVKLDMQGIQEAKMEAKERIKDAFFNKLFMMISENSPNGMTATEVSARQQEKLIMLGPVLERLTNELCKPLIETTFERLLMSGRLPPAPQELHGQDLNIEYKSILAQAQQATSVSGIDGFVSRIGEIAKINPGIMDKFDTDQYAEILADQLGVPPEMVRSSDEVAIIRNAQAQAQQKQQQMAMMQQGADALNKAGSVPTDSNSLGGNVIQMMQQKAAA